MRSAVLRYLSLSALFASVALLPACGGGSETDSGAVAPSGFTLKNNMLTFGGLANTHTIVGFRLQPMGGGEPIVSGPIALPPGGTLHQALPSGSYNVSVTYDDGRGERLQIPPDQVDAPSLETREVTFLY